MESLKLPPHDGSVISVVDMHTGGEPLRIVVSGYPDIIGGSVLAKRRYVREKLDHLRQLLMFEPRGHYDMYGALVVKSELNEAHLGVLFMHNEGYSTMCGHAVIALGRFAVDYGLVTAPQSPETQVNIHCPCGLVKAFVEYSNQNTGKVDRSPTGSGVTARIALQYHKGLIQLNQTRTFQSGTTGSLFTGKAVQETKCGDFKAVTVEVAGHAHYTGTASFVLENDDDLKNGFLLK
ncbi:UNVERIFIED_CONTAM: hypothetical protein FKN15_050741 [Acipenser sinensis]